MREAIVLFAHPHEVARISLNTNKEEQDMKALIVGLLSLAVLTACVTPIAPKSQLPPAGQGFCNANNGIFVIWVNNEGEKDAFVCPKIKGKSIRQESQRDPGVDIHVRTTDLGETKKYRAQDETDPCIDWTVGGMRYYFCW